MQRTTATYYDAIRKTWSGPKRKDFYGEDMTLGEVIMYSLSKIPDKVIQVMDTTGETLTAAQLIRDSKLVALKIQELGLKVGDVVGVNASNTPNLTAVMLGSLLCGTPIHAVHPDFDRESIKLIYDVSQPKLMFCDVETYETTKIAMRELNLKSPIVIINGEINNVLNVNDIIVNEDIELVDLKFPCNDMKGDDTASILCSSGTTGTPKGVCCSHRSLLNRPIFLSLSENAVTFTFSPMYWASGQWLLFTSLVQGVKRIITNKSYTPEYFIELIEKHRITLLLTTPHQWAPIIKNPDCDIEDRLSSLKTVLCGGSKVSKLISEPLNIILKKSVDGVIVGYGMSEVSAISRNEAHQRREGTDGKLEPNTEVRIVDSNGQFLGPNEEGILHVRLPYKWSGYYRNEEATQKSYVDGWLITGDIGYFDDDGYLHICTRNTDVFKSNNFQIYPELIEEVVMQLPGVLEVCIFGVPDFMTGNLCSCAVVRLEGEEGGNLSADLIKEHVKQKMSTPYHIKGEVYFVNELPKTGSGKVIRRKMAKFITNL